MTTSTFNPSSATSNTTEDKSNNAATPQEMTASQTRNLIEALNLSPDSKAMAKIYAQITAQNANTLGSSGSSVTMPASDTISPSIKASELKTLLFNASVSNKTPAGDSTSTSSMSPP